MPDTDFGASVMPVVTGRLAILLAIVSPFAIAVGQRSAPPRAAPSIVVGPSVEVSRSNASRDHTEILVAGDPANSNNLLVCTMLWSGEKAQLSTGIYMSADGGKSWKLTKDDARDDSDVWDPACTFAADGAALFSTLPTSNATRDSNAMMIYRSDDGGSTWPGSVRLPFIDRQYFSVDRSGGKYQGRIY